MNAAESTVREYALERKRKSDRERIAQKRAAMTAEERSEARRENDRLYRERHCEQRRHSQRTHRRGMSK